MQFRTVVDIPKPCWQLQPCEFMLFVGSCFADSMSKKFSDEAFPVVANPFGVMYNPASILHTIERLSVDRVDTAVLTLGTNHIYRLKETGEIVDNCQKRPSRLFQEEKLSVEQCADFLTDSLKLLKEKFPHVRVLLTVSPIRYAKYGYHESQLSKSTLLLAIEQVLLQQKVECPSFAVDYFPAYELVNDDLRDYRFYANDMLHPSEQAVDYIWERLVDAYFSQEAKEFLRLWQPLKKALSHRPFQPDSDAYRNFIADIQRRVESLRKRYPGMVVHQILPYLLSEQENLEP